MKVSGIIGTLLLSSLTATAQSHSEDVFEVTRTQDMSLRSGFYRPASLAEGAEFFLRERKVDPRISLDRQGKQSLDLASKSPIASVEYKFSLDGIPLCQYQFKSHQTSDGLSVNFGKIPNHNIDREYSLRDWPSQVIAQARAIEVLAENGISGQSFEARAQPCLWSDQGDLRAVYVFEIEANGLGYTVVADDVRSYKFQPRYFHSARSASIYPNNILDGETQEFPLYDMKESGYLENNYFVTVVQSPFESAIAASLHFAFDPETELSQFQETSLFTNANRTLEWLKSMGYKNFGSTPIRIVVHAEFQGDANNALYQPTANGASIYVGDGDGNILQNLSTDADVVGHELAHHVIYSTVTEIQGESLVLHEALADYFNFARAGNACLGESICPNTSFGNRICYVPNKCLRTADNSLTMTSANLPSAPHQRGQVISGMLWDLYTKDGLPIENVTRLVLNSIDLLVKDSGYKHFIVGMMMADQALFQGKNCDTIVNRALARGFSNSLGDVTCEMTALAEGTKVTDLLEDSSQQRPTTTAAKSKSTPRPTCGTIGYSGKAETDGLLFALYLLPLLPFAIRRLWSGK